MDLSLDIDAVCFDHIRCVAQKWRTMPT